MEVTPCIGSVDWSYSLLIRKKPDLPSLPVLGVWIEVGGRTAVLIIKDVTPCIGSVDWSFEDPIEEEFRKVSLPVLGVWIEVVGLFRWQLSQPCHSLYWECGLKSGDSWFLYKHLGSLPVLGVWIEVMINPFDKTTVTSLPVLGVWIEVKSWETKWGDIVVTPCIGSVDWSFFYYIMSICWLQSLPVLGVWIEVIAAKTI